MNAGPCAPLECRMNALELLRFTRNTPEVRQSVEALAVRLTHSLDEASVILVTARCAGEGATFLSVHLARALAGMGRETVLVDADLRASRLDAYYRRSQEKPPGLRNWMRGRAGLERILYHTDVPGLDILPAGGHAREPLPLFGRPAFPRLVRRLTGLYDYVLIDAPPLETAAETAVMAPVADAALLAVGAGMGRGEGIAAAAEVLASAGCPVLGAVLNHPGE